MARKNSLTAFFDYLGVGGLVLSGLALLDVAFVPVAPEAEALGLFTPLFFGALLAFACARTLQIAHLVRHRPQPRRERAAAAAGEPVVTGAAEPAAARNPFQRAA